MVFGEPRKALVHPRIHLGFKVAGHRMLRNVTAEELAGSTGSSIGCQGRRSEQGQDEDRNKRY
jgi:hypothetical protein